MVEVTFNNILNVDLYAHVCDDDSHVHINLKAHSFIDSN